MTDYNVGELVDITIKGACVAGMRVEGHDTDGTDILQVEITRQDGAKYYVAVPADWDAVTVERVAPEMKRGDLWRDRNGGLWFVGVDQGEMGLFDDTGGVHSPKYIVKSGGPLTRVHREPGEVTR